MRAPRLRVLVAAILLLGSISMGQLAAPNIVSACSCVRIDDFQLVEAADSPGTVVFIGTVTSISPRGLGSHDFGDMQIERVYKGVLPPVARVRGGGGGDCTMPLDVGVRMIWVAPYRDNLLEPHLCGMHRDITTLEGQQLVAAAERAFRAGETAAGDDPTAMPDDPDLAGFAIGMVGILVLVVLIVVLAAARRRRDEPGP